ncbi:MAG TPA: M56 family metallopeptidase [Candidatus Acidoferrum sp.]
MLEATINPMFWNAPDFVLVATNIMFWSTQVALLVVVAAILRRLFRIQQPRVLLAFWRVLLIASFALPAIQPWHKLVRVGELTIAMEPATDPRVLPPSSPGLSVWHVSTQQFVSVCGAVILLGIVVRLLMFAAGLRKLRQFRRRSQSIPSSTETGQLLAAMRKHVGCDADFRLSDDVESPVTFGWRAPSILFPAEFLTMEPQLQKAIACHELLHVRRHDWAMHFVEELIRVAMWFHPAILWLVAQSRLAREQVVDQQVLGLTGARKPYLEALLRFATDQKHLTAIPAPPFLAERQLARRVSVMLKEVRMSRTRLAMSLAAIAVLIGAAGVTAVWMFPLKAVAQNAPSTAVAGGVAGGIVGGVAEGVVRGVTDGVARGIAGGVSADEPQVDRAAIWTDEVKRGPMMIQVRGLGELVRDDASGKLIARISLPDEITKDVRANQSAMVDTRKGVVAGHVSELGQNKAGTRTIDIALDAALPTGAGAGLAIDATVDIEKIDDILYVGRPVRVMSGASSTVYKLTADGEEATRVPVKFGRASVANIEVLDGLKVGDTIILSDPSAWNGAEKIRLK